MTFRIGSNSTPINNQPEVIEGGAGSLAARFKPLSEGLDISVYDKIINMAPIGASNVFPSQKDDHTVVYKDAWDGVDLEYELRGETVKEIIVLKKKIKNPSFDFKVTGGKVINHPTKPGMLTLEGMPEDVTFSTLTVDVFGQGVISEERATQSISSAGIKISLDNKWFQTLREGDFPVRIDPTLNGGPVPATYYTMYKSDGYSCGSSTCYANTGSLNSSGWKSWRTYFKFPYYGLSGKNILYANMHGYYKTGQGGTDVAYPRYLGHANCWGFNCQGTYVGTANNVGGDFDIDFTWRLQQVVSWGDFEAVWSLWGNECGCLTYKPYWDMRATVVYDTPTPIATPVSPEEGQPVVDTQPTLKVNPVSDGDGETVQYYFRVATGSNAESGAVINSGWLTGTTEWTIPEGILQDGVTYYWHVYTLGGVQTNPNWTRSFKVNLRSGKDATQSYDSIGPMSVNLATGNTTTSTGTHTMGALGGAIGLNLDYDSPAKNKQGLIGEYWNVSSGYNFTSGAPTGDPSLKRNDQNINFDWTTSNPSPGIINDDWFYARWKGYFVAPTTGSYTFGGAADDAIDIYVNGSKVYGKACCAYSADYTGSTPVTLQAGQVVPIRVEYLEATYGANAKVFVKGAVTEQPIPREWLRTETQAVPTQYGLTGRYYTNDGSNNFPANDNDPMRLMMVRQDTRVSFNWGSAAPAYGLSADSFLARWTGYITVPTSGSYTLGKNSDDGVRIKTNTGLFGAQQTTLDSWGYAAGDVWGSAVTLTAGQQMPIIVEYNDAGGPGSMYLKIKGPGLSASGEEIPVTWLSPKANVVPDSWRVNVDVDGSVGYERLRVVGQNVILEDSTRAAHEYTWVDGRFNPPLNEQGQLTRNADNTYTLLDIDGRTYVFDSEGKLLSVTTATDDRTSAALKYEYSGSPSRLTKITDGVTSSRYGTLHYKGVNEDGNCSVPSGFDAAPDGMICAFKTTDGNITKFYYKSQQLSRIEKPGGELTDYGYDTLGRITSTRDSLANDAIVASVRSDDDNVKTQMTYDDLGRLSSLTAPAPTSGATRVVHTLEYLPSATQLHVTGASEPNGFSKRVEYDNLLRTSRVVDVANLATQTEWDTAKDLQLSTTDTAGLKSTNIYDVDDRTVDSYGPAPTAWYGTDRKPLTSYVNQVPHIGIGYDENMYGLGISTYSNKNLLGAPKYTTTGFGNLPYASFGLGLTNSSITPTDGLSIRATGKIKLDQVGDYAFHLWHADGARLYINNTLITSDWADGQERFSPDGVFVNATAGKTYDITIEAYRSTTTSDSYQRVFAMLAKKAPGAGAFDDNVGAMLKPAYNLVTSRTAYDSQIGNISTVNTYNQPQYGMIDKTTLDPTGLNLQANMTYETAGTGFLRQTSKTLAGGNTTAYQHYAATDTRDNPCTVGVEAINQGGQSKGKTEADPDGTGSQVSRTSETIYNESGLVVATRYNSDSWTCTTYDTRSRMTQTIIPMLGSKPGRTITNDYAVGGNPLITSSDDGTGMIKVENDLLGRTTKYTDAKGKVTENSYNTYGKLVGRISPIGTETYVYDNYDRMTTYKLDGVTFASITYGAYSRIQSIDYPAGISLDSSYRDGLGRMNKITYTTSGGAISDEVNRSVIGNILSGTENGVSKSYTYDKALRLTGANIGGNAYSYDFGTEDASCNALAGNNVNAGKDGNRTKMIVNGQSTTYCYDQADRLITSSDVRFANAQYDSHGNTTSLGDTDHKTEFAYDSNDRNTSILENYTGGHKKEVAYERDLQGRLTKRVYKVDDQTVGGNYYGYTGSGDSPDFLMDSNGDVTQKYLSLPGGVEVTIKPDHTSAGAVTYSLPNFHGDIMATVNADGTVTSTAITGPFGEKIVGQQAPINTAEGASWNYLGGFQKNTDIEFAIMPIQMGGRVYIPELGRFLQVDPVEGGTDNSYVYVNDPVNRYDLNGQWSIGGFISSVVSTVTRAITKVATATVKAVTKVVTTIATTVSYVARKVVAPAVNWVVSTAKAAGAAVAGAASSATRGAVASLAQNGEIISLTATVVGIGVCAATALIGCTIAAGVAMAAGAAVAAAQSAEKHGDARRAVAQATGSIILDAVTGLGAGRLAAKAFGSADGVGRAAIDMNGAPAVFGGGMLLEDGIDWLCDQTKGAVC